ncbi:MAG: hypothetical protein WC685_07580 [Methylobacter sp.]|jgi:hypothetical protein
MKSRIIKLEQRRPKRPTPKRRPFTMADDAALLEISLYLTQNEWDGLAVPAAILPQCEQICEVNEVPPALTCIVIDKANKEFFTLTGEHITNSEQLREALLWNLEDEML